MTTQMLLNSKCLDINCKLVSEVKAGCSIVRCLLACNVPSELKSVVQTKFLKAKSVKIISLTLLMRTNS